MMHATISSKFQIVIPKPAREHLNLKPQQKLTVIEKDNMLILIPQQSLNALRGIATGAAIDNYRDKRGDGSARNRLYEKLTDSPS